MRFRGGVELEASALAGVPDLETLGLIAAERGRRADGESFFARLRPSDRARGRAARRPGPALLGPPVRILLVSQMYPGPADPDLGVFVRQLELALRERGHEIELAVLDRRAGGKRRFLELRRQVRSAARPDVVWAHFLVPSGLIAASVDAPLVVTAHGRDVRNVGSIPGIAALTRRVVERATTVIAVSDYLRRELELKLPAARGKTVVIDSGVDLDRFAAAAASRSGLGASGLRRRRDA